MGDHYGMAQDLVRFTCDPGSILAWDALPLTAPAAVRIGEGRIGGRRVARGWWVPSMVDDDEVVRCRIDACQKWPAGSGEQPSPARRGGR